MDQKNDIDIERLLSWAYNTQKIGVIAARSAGLFAVEAKLDGMEIRKVSGDGCYAVMQSSTLGVKIDNSGIDIGKAHPDAEMVHEVLTEFAANDEAKSIMARLLYKFALCGSRPDWMPGARTRMVSIANSRGNPKLIYNDNRKPIACLVSVENPPEMIEFRRAIYRSWWEGLTYLASIFKKKPNLLIRHSVTGPAAKPSPWNNK